MKKKMMAVMLAGMMVLAAGCGKEGKITVGEYKGLVLTSVSDDSVDASINAMLEENFAEVQVVERAAEDGDTVNINYEGTKDGVAFEGGTDDSEEGTDLVLGSGSFIDGFEDGLLGAVAGEERDLELTFPEDYDSEELAGQAVVFHVKVNAVKTSVVPELTDAFVAENFPNYTTAEEYWAAYKEGLNYETYCTQITEQLMNTSEVAKYNEAEVKAEKESLIAEYTSYAEYYGSIFGLDTESALTSLLGFESIEAFNEEMGNYAYERVKNYMIIDAIAEAEGIELTTEEYNSQVVEYAAAYGYEDVAAFEEACGKELIQKSILANMVMELIIENAVLTEVQ